MLNNLIKNFAGNDFNLSQLAEILNLKKAENTEDADFIRLKITQGDNLIFEGGLSELLIKKLLAQYGESKIYEFSLNFDNIFVEVSIFIDLQ